jgi:hypothetical protein
MLNRRQRREFEQKAAKETKANQGLGFRHGRPGRDFGAFPIVVVVLEV